MATYKVPSQASNAGQTFSDSLVGNQITDGTSQLTNTNFALDKVIPQKDAKTFKTEPFSAFLTLDDLKIETGSTTTYSKSGSTERPIKFNDSKKDAGKSLFGSLRERSAVSFSRIIKNFPAAILADPTSPIGVSTNTAENVTFSFNTNRSTFKVQTSLLYNPLDVVINKPKSNVSTESTNPVRNFYSSYKKYVIDLNGTVYPIVNYVEPNTNNEITLEVLGKPFTGATYSGSYLIRPYDGIVEEFYIGLDDLEQTLLNRETYPKFTATFEVPRDTFGGSKTELIGIQATWPTSKDGWNIQIIGLDYDTYVDTINSLAIEIDEFKSNLVVRFLTSPQLFEFDTVDQKTEKIFQLYGQSFDSVKKYIDNIAYMRNVTYDSINNLPDIFLKNLANTLGLDTINLFDQKALDEQLYNASKQMYDGVPIGKTLVEAELEFYRRLLVNLAFIYKSKGTRSSLEFFLKFIGAPEAMIKIDEFIYKVKSSLPLSVVEEDIFKVIEKTNISRIATFNTSTYAYDVTESTGNTGFTKRTDFPVDENTGLPITPTTNLENSFFQRGAGWFRETTNHRSYDILDEENSVTTGRTKTLVTKSSPFTYGEDFYDYYKTLPGLDYGYELESAINNDKTEIIEDTDSSKLTLNRKNINAFVSPSNGIDYDIWRKSQNLELTFGTMPPQLEISFAEFLQNTLSSTIKNSHTIKYKKNYFALEDVYRDYINQIGSTSYNFTDLYEFVDKMSPYWTNILDQIVPSTTLWLGGNLIENNYFGRSKYAYKKKCQPIKFIDNLYPDFETAIEEDLETILGEYDNFRTPINLTGVTYVLAIDIDGTEYTGTTKVYLTGSTIFTGNTTGGTFIPNSDCTILTSGSTYAPLICDFKEWIKPNLPTIKTSWKNALSDLIDEINETYTGYTAGCIPSYAPYSAVTSGATCTQDISQLSYEIFTDSDGIEKIRFYSNVDENGRCTVKNSVDFYFYQEYQYPIEECTLQISGYTPCDIYSGGTENCELVSDVYFNISGAIGVENPISGWPVTVFYDCSENYNQDISGITICTKDCLVLVKDVYENGDINGNPIDLIFTDAANCEQKIRIEGLQLKVEYDPHNVNSSYTGYTIHPKLQYRETFDYGIKKGTKILKATGSTVNVSSLQYVQSGISSGAIVETNIEDISIDDYVLSANLLPPPYSTTDLRKASISGYSFTYNYKLIRITNTDCLGSVKKHVINGEFDVLPTTKLRVLRNGKFVDVYPEELNIRPEQPIEPCCDVNKTYYQDINGDFLLNQFGFPIEVTSVELDYCSKSIFYHLNYSGSTDDVVLFNGNSDDQILLSFTQTKFNNNDFSAEQFYQDGVFISDFQRGGPYSPACNTAPEIECPTEHTISYYDCGYGCQCYIDYAPIGCTAC